MNNNLEKIKFSVAICVYIGDDAEHFQTALESISHQTIVPSEITIVLDGPVTIQLQDVIETYKSSISDRIECNVITLIKNMGHGYAREISIKNCKHEIIALMDADDISIESRFEKQLEVLVINKSLAIVGSDIDEFIGEVDNVISKRRVPTNHEDIVKYSKKRCPLNQVTVMFRKSEIISAGGYINWYHEEDYYLWIRMILNGSKFANINESLVLVRVGNEMYRRRGGIKYFKSEYKMHKFMFDKNHISFFTFVSNILKRLLVQLILPISIRQLIYIKFARSKK